MNADADEAERRLDVLCDGSCYKKYADVHTEDGVARFRRCVAHLLTVTEWETLCNAEKVVGCRPSMAEDKTLSERRMKYQYVAGVECKGKIHAFKTMIVCLSEPSAELMAYPECIKVTKPCDAFVVLEDCDVVSLAYGEAINSRPTTWFGWAYKEFVLAFK